MSLAVVLTRGLAGMHARPVRVEVHVGGGLPGFHVVGLPETEVREALAMTLAAHRDGRAFVMPEVSAKEAALVPGAVVHPAKSLLQVCAHLTGQERLVHVEGVARANDAQWPDLAEVKGQAQARRALEIAAAGGHSILVLGPIEPRSFDVAVCLVEEPPASVAR